MKAREAQIEELQGASAAATDAANEAQVGSGVRGWDTRAAQLLISQTRFIASVGQPTACRVRPPLPQKLKAKVHQLEGQLSSSRDSEAQLQVGARSCLLACRAASSCASG